MHTYIRNDRQKMIALLQGSWINIELFLHERVYRHRKPSLDISGQKDQEERDANTALSRRLNNIGISGAHTQFQEIFPGSWLSTATIDLQFLKKGLYWLTIPFCRSAISLVKAESCSNEVWKPWARGKPEQNPQTLGSSLYWATLCFWNL